ncbi:hypothetical protein Trydic_g15331 [Trypoxylus dichotomus]
MSQVYDDNCLSRTNVFLRQKRFVEGRERLKDNKHEGISARIPEVIEKVRGFIANDRNASLKMMEEDFNISTETVRIILHEDWTNTKVCVKFNPHSLLDGPKWVRIDHSTQSLQPPKMI